MVQMERAIRRSPKYQFSPYTFLCYGPIVLEVRLARLNSNGCFVQSEEGRA